MVLYPDTFTNYNHPNLGMASVKVLEALGYEVIVPRVRCCGRPMLSKGMMDKAKRSAAANVRSVLPHVRSGAKLVGIEPSCILSFRDDYVDLLGTEEAQSVSESTMLLEEFVLHAIEEEGATLEFSRPPERLLLHGHCHQKALVGTQAAMRVLRSLPGCDAAEIPSGCCGMAGSFGFEKEHYDISMRIGEQTLFPAIRSQEEGVGVVAEGVSCRQQIEQGTGRRALHLAEVLAEAL